MTSPKASVRINKYIADMGIASRRAADDLVKNGVVYINGKRAMLGDTVSNSDKVEVRTRKTREYVYLAVHKPRGLITHAPETKEKDILSLLPKDLVAKKVFPVGRLDKDSSGLIIVTNDGRVTTALLDPKRHVEKEYLVKTKEEIKDGFVQKLTQGVYIEGYKTQPAKASLVNDHLFRIVLTEGKKHQIRRMTSALNVQVKELKRVRIGHLKLGTLAPGEYAHTTFEKILAQS